MKRVGKPVFFIVAIFIIVFTAVAFFGISTQFGDVETVYIKGAGDIRWGIDIRGGVDVTFKPADDAVDVTDAQMSAAEAIIKTRLVSQNINDYEVYTDYSGQRIIVRFPWKSDETNFDPAAAVEELGETASLTFRDGQGVDDEGMPTGEVILNGSDVLTASVVFIPNELTQITEPAVSLELTDSGIEKFAEATGRLAESNGVISIWMDDTMISAPQVNEQISDGMAIISGNFTTESATELADKINAGALPFELVTDTFRTISPKLGMGARDAMFLSCVIAYILIVIFMIIFYRLPGVVAGIALLGQIGGTIAAISGFFPFFSSFTLTVPGIAGIILAVGVGVDANIITASRIREELYNGKSLDGAIDAGFKRGFTAVFDGNITMVLIALILMGAFGTPDSFLAVLLKPLFFAFGATTEGTIYSFGYTLVVGVIFNFLMGITASRLMLKSLSKFKCFRNPALYGGAKSC